MTLAACGPATATIGVGAVALRKQRGFREIRDETARAGAPEGRAAGFRADDLALLAPPATRGRPISSRPFSGLARRRPRITRCRITRARGTRIGPATTAATTIPTRRAGTITFRSLSSRGRTRFTARCPITTSPTGSSNRKRRWSFRGSGRPSCSRAIPSARIAGLRSAAATASATRNGRIAGRSGPIIFNTFSGTSGRRLNLNHGAGLDVSPAVRDYLGLGPTSLTDWQFVEVRDVPPGPWRNYGDNNNFVIARRQTEQRLAEQYSTKTKAKK